MFLDISDFSIFCLSFRNQIKLKLRFSFSFVAMFRIQEKSVVVVEVSFQEVKVLPANALEGALSGICVGYLL